MHFPLIVHQEENKAYRTSNSCHV